MSDLNSIAAPPLDDDEALAEWLADQLVELARTPGPVRLAAFQAAGLLREPGEISHREIGSALGIHGSRVSRTERVALEKLRHRIGTYL